jgi:hypothetical protein
MTETYAFRSPDHATIYGWGTPEEAETFLAVMRTARPCAVEQLSEADLDALPLGERILSLSIAMATPL